MRCLYHFYFRCGRTDYDAFADINSETSGRASKMGLCTCISASTKGQTLLLCVFPGPLQAPSLLPLAHLLWLLFNGFRSWMSYRPHRVVPN